MRLVRSFKMISIAAMSALLIAGIANPAGAASAAVKVTVDNQAVRFPDAQPYTESNRVLIPVRFVSEALGATVDYKNKTVYITSGSGKVTLPVNSSKVTVGGKTVSLDVPARVRQDRTYVPLRFVSEALGASVDWNQAQRLVTITTDNGQVVVPVPETPEVPEDQFGFKPGYTSLAKALFTGNVQTNGSSLIITIPENVEANFYTQKGKKTSLTPGKKYTYPIKEGEGFISITQIYPGKDDLEGYSIFLDGAYKGGQTGSVIVRGNNGKKIVQGDLQEVIKLAGSL